jgi:hypothetical protein
MSELVRRLACYLRANPLAGDTKEGITLWWLGLDPSSMDEVERALLWLQTTGLLEAVRQTDGLVYYRRTAQDASSDNAFDQLIQGITAP